MKLELFQNNSSDNVINKNLTSIANKYINLKQATNLYHTFLVFKNDTQTDYSKINYAKMLDKCYFVSSEAIQNDSLIRLELKEDVLETYKDNILNSNADIIEKSTPSNNGIIKTSKEVETFKMPSSMTLPKTQSIIMVTVSK